MDNSGWYKGNQICKNCTAIGLEVCLLDVFDKFSLYKNPRIKRYWKKKRDKLKNKEGSAVLEAGVCGTSVRVRGYADRHRRSPTHAERLFRSLLCKGGVDHYFQSQVPLFGFIVDFYCASLMLGVEIDGKSHKKQKEYDEHRSAVLYVNGVRIIRFTNKEVKKHPFEVISKVCQEIGVSKQLKKIRKKVGIKGKVYLAGENSQDRLASMVPSLRNWDGPKEPYIPKWMS